MPDVQHWFAGATEEFPPSELLEQAKAAEAAGFDAVGVTDHVAPWFPDGRGTHGWVTLAALGQVTTRPLHVSVTPVLHHYHPAVVAQAFMSLEELYPGRIVLGVGSGEALNEVPLGLDWPSPAEKLERFRAGLEAITRLWDGETVTMDGGWFRLKDARLWTHAGRRPRLIVSAFGPQAADIAGQYGDGLWTLGDPEQAPEVIEAYREACARHERPVGDIVLQAGFAWAATQEEAIAGARRWKPTQLPELYREDIHDQGEMQRRADEAMSDEEFAKEGFIVASDPGEHVERIREIERIGADAVCLQLIGQADPLGTLRTYGETVLPALRTARAAAR